MKKRSGAVAPSRDCPLVKGDVIIQTALIPSLDILSKAVGSRYPTAVNTPIVRTSFGRYGIGKA